MHFSSDASDARKTGQTGRTEDKSPTTVLARADINLFAPLTMAFARRNNSIVGHSRAQNGAIESVLFYIALSRPGVASFSYRTVETRRRDTSFAFDNRPPNEKRRVRAAARSIGFPIVYFISSVLMRNVNQRREITMFKSIV